MATIDIALPDELMTALAPPPCAVLSLPPVGKAEVTLPIGGSLQGVADFTRGIPTQCSMNISLMLQLAPMMASMECLLKILKFIGKVVGVINGITQPMTLISAIPNIVAAAADLEKTCIGMVIPPFLPTLCFLKDLLELIATMILCVVDELDSVLKMLSGLQLQISAATAAGNHDLVLALQCAQDNATTSAEGIMQSLQPITVLLTLAGIFMSIAGQNLSVTIPSAVPASDLQAMQSMLDELGGVAKGIKHFADGLPC
jgi:hypothetical protein